MYSRNMVRLRYIIVNTLHKGGDDDNDNNDNNNNVIIIIIITYRVCRET